MVVATSFKSTVYLWPISLAYISLIFCKDSQVSTPLAFDCAFLKGTINYLLFCYLHTTIGLAHLETLLTMMPALSSSSNSICVNVVCFRGGGMVLVRLMDYLWHKYP